MGLFDERISPVLHSTEVESAAPNTEQKEELQPKPIRVWVSHGDLGSAKHPVVVGHYVDDVIRSAEEVLNRRLGGQLETLRDLGLYPGPVRTVRVVMVENAYPQGAIVVGLGRIGDLMPGNLTASFANAVLHYTAHVAGGTQLNDSVEPAPIGLTTLLLGVRDAGISTADSIKAILAGLLEAQEMLLRSRFRLRVRLEELEIMEIRRDRAIRAAHLLPKVCQNTEWQTRLSPATVLECKNGGKNWLPASDDRDWWHRLQIKESRQKKRLVFTSPTRRAGMAEALLPSQLKLVERFIRKSVSTIAWNEEMATTLFELLLPNELKRSALEGGRLILEVDEDAARYPWELLHNASHGSEPLAVRNGVIRQLATPIRRTSVISPTARRIFVVGDPITDFKPLPGAEEEARLVKDLFQNHDFEVVDRIREPADRIVPLLYSKEYRVVHFSGHGAYRFQNKKTKTGIVLDQGSFLTPFEISQMQQVPELVFVNCCHSGYIAGGERSWMPNQFAANISWQLIQMGVRAVISAGWAVDDEAAIRFAEIFYRSMLSGGTFGDAVIAARRAAWEDHPSTNTWGAYQCYGDPDYVLDRRAPQVFAGADRQFVDASEVASLIDDLAGEAVSIAYADAGQILDQLESLLATAPSDWLKSPAMLENVGQLYAQLGAFEKAVEHYTQALETEKGAASLKTIEQRANLQAKLAVELAKRAGGGPPPQSFELIDRAKADLTRLLEYGRTSERLSLLGSTCKRLAQISAGDRRVQALREAAEHYQSAHRLALEKTGKENYYPLLNWLLARVLLSRIEGKTPPDIEDEVQKALDSARRQEEKNANFWSGVALADALLTQHLASGDLESHLQRIVEGYRTARTRSASFQQFNSIIQQIECIVDILTDRGGAESPRDPARQALGTILEELVRIGNAGRAGA